MPVDEFNRLLDANLSDVARARAFAALARINTLYMIAGAWSGHIGTSFSSLDLMSWVFLNEMRDLKKGPQQADIFFSSKGHDAPALYNVLIGLGLLVAPLCALYADLERTTALILRALFYATPIIYSVKDLPGPFETIGMFNPLAGIMTLYRMAFFPGQWDPLVVIISAVMSLMILALGIWVFRTLERPVLKEL